ncbi:transcription initiation factor TFIIH subunit 4 [Pancytospora philotis]|nr:transcription initiation factor TFIIH subunit 4 [Pancytospora philotis]
MAEACAFIHHLCSSAQAPALYSDPLFVLGLVKLMGEDTRRLVFSLTTESAHISRLKEVPGIKESLSLLLQMRLVSIAANLVVLDSAFRGALLAGLCCPALDAQISEALPAAEGAAPVLTEGLRTAVREVSACKYQGMLQAIISKTADSLYAVKDILVSCELLDSRDEITRKGFEFLLKSKSEQCWLLVLHSIQYFAQDAAEEHELLAAAMEMCTKRSIGLFTAPRGSRWFAFLNSIGIIHTVDFGACKRQRNEPTLRESAARYGVDSQPFADLASAVRHRAKDGLLFCLNNTDLFRVAAGAATATKKYIVLETNYRIYAYTNKPYEMSILSLFSRIIYVLPNLVKSQLDEESMCHAFSKGITAQQILKYLGEFSQAIPPSVANQIGIWESKQHRIRLNGAVLYSDFLHFSDYLSVLGFLEQLGGVLLRDEAKRIIIGSEDTYDKTRDFIKGL